VGERIRDVGREFGTTTGRGRRCGWLDLVLLRKSVRLNSLSALAVTRLDVLSSFESLPVATSYRLGGREVREPPQDAGHLAEAEPVYASLEGWHEDVSRCASLEELPDAARAYLRFIERETGVPVAVVSVGPSREQTIWSAPDALWG
jgi:adenylosuccinate synthase